MLNTYSIKGNTVIIPFAINTAVSKFKFSATFQGGDTEALGGRKRRAVYKTSKPMEQLAIEKSELYRKGIITKDDSVETIAEIKAKAEAAALRMKEEEAIEEVGAEADPIFPESKPTKKKK